VTLAINISGVILAPIIPLANGAAARNKFANPRVTNAQCLHWRVKICVLVSLHVHLATMLMVADGALLPPEVRQENV